MTKIFVKPGPGPDGKGLLVRHPAPGRAHFKPEGEEVDLARPEHATYTRRRLKSGDLVQVTRPAAAPSENTADTSSTSSKSGKGKG